MNWDSALCPWLVSNANREKVFRGTSCRTIKWILPFCWPEWSTDAVYTQHRSRTVPSSTGQRFFSVAFLMHESPVPALCHTVGLWLWPPWTANPVGLGQLSWFFFFLFIYFFFSWTRWFLATTAFKGKKKIEKNCILPNIPPQTSPSKNLLFNHLLTYPELEPAPRFCLKHILWAEHWWWEWESPRQSYGAGMEQGTRT